MEFSMQPLAFHPRLVSRLLAQRAGLRHMNPRWQIYGLQALWMLTGVAIGAMVEDRLNPPNVFVGGPHYVGLCTTVSDASPPPKPITWEEWNKPLVSRCRNGGLCVKEDAK